MKEPTMEHDLSTPELAPETLMAYMDGELDPEARARVEAVLARHTEARRELILFQHLHEDLSGIRLRAKEARASVWGRVHQRLTRPLGWLLVAAGTVAWLLYGAWMYVSSAVPTVEKLMTGAVVIGILMLFTSVIHERYREWLVDPYRDVER
jgi:anti-sigma factor RsiW